MPQYRGFKAWLQSEDGVLEEYSVGRDPRDERVGTCWVPSEVGKRFTIHWEPVHWEPVERNSDFELLVSTIIDGIDSGGHFSNRTSKGRKLGMRINEHEIRPFIFSEIKLTDDDSAIQRASKAAHIGTIELSLRFVKTQQCTHGCKATFERHPMRDETVHEKTKKAGGHRVVLGDAVKLVNRKSSLHHTPVDPEDGGFHALFKFTYRPRAFLMAQGIIPPTVPESQKPSAAQPVRAARKRKRGPDKQILGAISERIHCIGSSSTKPQSTTRHTSVKEEEVDGLVRQNGAVDVDDVNDELNALEQQLLATQQQIARFRARKVKRKSSPRTNALASGLVVNSDGAIDLTLD